MPVECRPTHVTSEGGLRNSLSARARSALCDGVKFRWRDGFIRSASHSSAHNSSADFERSSFDVVDEASGFINLRAIRIILRERAGRSVGWNFLVRRTSLQREMYSNLLDGIDNSPRGKGKNPAAMILRNVF